MKKYILKRIIMSVITVLILITVVFFLVRLMPGGPFTNPKLTPEVKAVMEAYYGLDKPLPVQYVQYLKNLLHGDLGYSMSYSNQTVTSLILKAFPYSADVGIRALVFAFSVGIVLGIIAALNRGKKLDFLCIIIAIIGTSVPDFIMGGILQYFFGIRWGLLPIAQYKGIEYTILPMISLGFATLASVSRIMRSSMLEVVNQDYIKTARAKGISEFQVITRHEIRNAIMPLVTIMGPLVASILTGTFVIESIFAIPGMGKYYVDSISSLDYTMVLGMTVFYGVLLVIATTITDIVYGLVDPRIRVS
ncbi:MAG: ABC transporter permease [Ruminococcus sp.]|nr:ABC transporter permease [Ruminococcus sp.]